MAALSFVRLEEAFLWQQDAILRLEQAISSESENIERWTMGTYAISPPPCKSVVLAYHYHPHV
jgi:hypothetical protein